MNPRSPVERLRDALSAAGVGLTAEELADVLWLAGRLPPQGLSGAPAAPAEPAGHHPPAAPHPAPPTDSPFYGSARPPSQGTDMYAAAGALIEGTAALPVLVRAERALPSPRRLARALRPLKRPVPSPREEELDESATADLVADTGVLDLAMRPGRERWLDAALVVDDGLSMHIWRELSVELESLLQSTGIFRRVRSYGLDTRHPDGPRLRSRPFAPGGALLPPRAVCPVDGRGVVLVLSDVVGAGWRAGRLDGLLAGWARSCATAVFQPLPQRLWPGAGLRTETKLLQAGRAGSANAAWRVTDPVLPPDLAPFTGLPVPVVEFSPAGVESWIGLVARGSAVAAQVAEVAYAPRTAEPAVEVTSAAEPVTDMRSRLALFRSAASPEAYQLAGHLAAVRPLTLPVMRLVQRAVLGGRGSPAHLAEVLLGGLLRRSPAGEAGEVRQTIRYDFRPGLRELLLESVPAREVMGTAALVTNVLHRRSAGGRYVPALRADLSGTIALPQGSSAFARADTPLLRHFGPGAPAPGSEPIADVPFGALADHDPELAALVDGQRWREAVELGERVLDRLLAELGPEHPAVLSGRLDLADWIGEAGAPQTALRLCRELLTDLTARLGPEHGRVLTLRARLGHWNGRSGEPAAAVAAYRELLPEQERLLGPDHPDCLFSRHQTAFWTGAGGDPATALALYRDLLAIQLRVLGPEDRETLRTRSNVASQTGLSGRPAESLELWRALLPDVRRVLGADDLLTLVSEVEIGHYSAEMGDPAAALRLIPPLLPRLAELFGPEHPTPYGYRRRIVHWTGVTGEVNEAVRLVRELLADVGARLTPESPTFLGVRAEYAYWTARAGEPAKGLRLLRDLLPELDGILGPDHPDTRWVAEEIARLEQEA